jgi:hypothetical protein
MDENLTVAIANCIDLDRKTVYESSLNSTWERCKDIFLENLIPIRS